MRGICNKYHTCSESCEHRKLHEIAFNGDHNHLCMGKIRKCLYVPHIGDLVYVGGELNDRSSLWEVIEIDYIKQKFDIGIYRYSTGSTAKEVVRSETWDFHQTHLKPCGIVNNMFEF